MNNFSHNVGPAQIVLHPSRYAQLVGLGAPPGPPPGPPPGMSPGGPSPASNGAAAAPPAALAPPSPAGSMWAPPSLVPGKSAAMVYGAGALFSLVGAVAGAYAGHHFSSKDSEPLAIGAGAAIGAGLAGALALYVASVKAAAPTV